MLLQGQTYNLTLCITCHGKISLDAVKTIREQIGRPKGLEKASQGLATLNVSPNRNRDSGGLTKVPQQPLTHSQCTIGQSTKCSQWQEKWVKRTVSRQLRGVLLKDLVALSLSKVPQPNRQARVRRGYTQRRWGWQKVGASTGWESVLKVRWAMHQYKTPNRGALLGSQLTGLACDHEAMSLSFLQPQLGSVVYIISSTNIMGQREE